MSKRRRNSDYVSRRSIQAPQGGRSVKRNENRRDQYPSIEDRSCYGLLPSEASAKPIQPPNELYFIQCHLSLDLRHVTSTGYAPCNQHRISEAALHACSALPGGVGAARKPPVFMRQGDVFEVEIEGIGVLSNPVQDG
jgi:hypothetical protein